MVGWRDAAPHQGPRAHVAKHGVVAILMAKGRDSRLAPKEPRCHRVFGHFQVLAVWIPLYLRQRRQADDEHGGEDDRDQEVGGGVAHHVSEPCADRIPRHVAFGADSAAVLADDHASVGVRADPGQVASLKGTE